MLKKVIIENQIRPKEFFKFISAKEKRKLLNKAKPLKGKRVVHINATEVGGGVVEILTSLIPYLRSLGIESDWYVIDPKAGNDFFSFTNKLHNALQGAPVKFSAKEWDLYRKVSHKIAENLGKIDFDILSINDPQPLLAGSLVDKKAKIYFSHIDTSNTYMPVWKKIFPAIDSYGHIVFSNKKFVHGSLSPKKVDIFTPAIDPLSEKQKITSRNGARRYLKKYGIRESGPLIVQVSRFDVWKNPLEVVGAFCMLKNLHKDAQLALVGFNGAKDNPDSAMVYKDVVALVKKSPDIHLFFHPRGKNVTEFTAMAQSAADVIVQNSTKEGFGLTVAEAMWKKQPVIGGPAAGLRVQIKDGRNGFITETPEELAQKISYLLSHPKQKKRMGESAHRTVVKNFIFSRLVTDHLEVYNRSLSK